MFVVDDEALVSTNTSVMNCPYDGVWCCRCRLMSFQAVDANDCTICVAARSEATARTLYDRSKAGIHMRLSLVEGYVAAAAPRRLKVEVVLKGDCHRRSPPLIVFSYAIRMAFCAAMDVFNSLDC